MKMILINTLLAVASLSVAGPALNAQTSFRYVADVPFSFHAANTELQPGKYIVARTIGSSVDWIRSAEGAAQLAICSGPQSLEQKAGKPHLVFRRHGYNYYLAQIWNSEGKGTTVPRSKEEMSIRETMALNGHDVVTVYLASVR